MHMLEQNQPKRLSMWMLVFVCAAVMSGCGFVDGEEEGDELAELEAGEPVVTRTQALDRPGIPPLRPLVKRVLRKTVGNNRAYIGSPEGCTVQGRPRANCPEITGVSGNFLPAASTSSSASYELDGRIGRALSPTASDSNNFSLIGSTTVSF